MSLTPQVYRSLRIAWQEGIPAHIMLAVIDYFLVPYALFLGLSPTQVGWVVAVPHLMSAMMQLIAVRSLQWFRSSRVYFLVMTTLFQSMMLFSIALIVFFRTDTHFYALILCVSIFRILLGLSNTIWGSLVSDYLPPEKRGHYMGWRAQITGLSGMLGVIFSGVFLFYVKKISEVYAFFLLFLFAALCRAISSHLMAKFHDVKHEWVPGTHFSFFDFIRQAKKSNFVKFVLYSAGIMFATHVAAPYYSVYLLEELKLNYLLYMFIHFSGIVAGLISYPIWGKHADITGNARLLKLVGFLISFVPVCWLFSKNVVYLMFIEFYAGFVWGAFALCTVTFIFDAVTPAKRARCLGYFNLISGLGIFLGTVLGGQALEIFPKLLGSSFYSIFLLSGILRFSVFAFLGRAFQEIRHVQPVTQGQLLASVCGVRPLVGLARGWNVFPELEQKPKVE